MSFILSNCRILSVLTDSLLTSQKAMYKYVARELALRSLAIFLITIGLCTVPTHTTKVELDGFRAFCACIILNSLNTPNAVPAKHLWQNLTDTIDSSDQSRCDSWNEYPDHKVSIFSDRFAKPTTDILKSVGAFAPDIYAYCGPSEIGEVSTAELIS